MASVNDIIGNYRLVKELSSGAFGRVYQGEHVILTNRTVAIKLLHSTHLNSQQERDSFIHEAKLLEQLRHPHILPIIDVGLHDGFPYLVTEYEPNGSLRDRLQQQPTQPFQTEEILTILSQVGQALQHAHQQNIIHRDLKPENILFKSKGEALLADFGISTVYSTLSLQQATIIGTPAYMAPEQFRGLLCKESDEYALGCIAYELFTGHKPFTAPDFIAIGFKHMMEQPVAPRQFNPALPVQVEQAILKAMAKQRTDRYAEVSSFIAALHPSPVRISTPSSSPKTKEQLLDEALAHHEAKRYREALAAYEQAIQIDPDFSYAYNGKSLALYNLKRYREAFDTIEHAIVLTPSDPSLYYGKGRVLEQMQDYQDALRAYEQALRLDPRYALAWHKKGDVLHQMNHRKESLAAYERAKKLDTGEM